MEDTTYLISYVLSAFSLWVCFIIFRLYETWYCNKTDKVIYRDVLVYRTLSRKQKSILSKKFDFYKRLPPKEQRRFEHRVKVFLKETTIIGRNQLAITEEREILIGAVAMMLTFGRKHYSYELVDTILVYPAEFYSTINETYHKGEFNPMRRTIVFSWKDFEEGYQITDDNLNLGIHEFMHALQMGAKKSADIDALRLERVFQRILKVLMQQEVKKKLDEVKYFRAYAFTNQYEFLAVLVEYFFESPQDFKQHFPEIYGHTKTLLNFDFLDY